MENLAETIKIEFDKYACPSISKIRSQLYRVYDLKPSAMKELPPYKLNTLNFAIDDVSEHLWLSLLLKNYLNELRMDELKLDDSSVIVELNG